MEKRETVTVRELYNKYVELTLKNEQLSLKINELVSENAGLKIEKLSNLTTIKQLEDEVRKLTEENNQLKQRIKSLEDKELLNTDMTITFESINLFDKILVENILGYSKSKNKPIKLSDIVYEEIKLNAEQQKKYDEIQEYYGNLENLIKIMSQFKRNRNDTFHYTNPDLSTSDIFKSMRRYIDKFKQENKDTFMDLTEAILEKVEDKAGEYPFVDREEVPKFVKKRK